MACCPPEEPQRCLPNPCAADPGVAAATTQLQLQTVVERTQMALNKLNSKVERLHAKQLSAIDTLKENAASLWEALGQVSCRDTSCRIPWIQGPEG